MDNVRNKGSYYGEVTLEQICGETACGYIDMVRFARNYTYFL